MQKVKRKSEDTAVSPKKKKSNNPKPITKGVIDEKLNSNDKTKNSGPINKFVVRKNFADKNNKFGEKKHKFGDKNKKFGDKNKKFGDKKDFKKDGFKGKFGKPGQGKPGTDAANVKPVWSDMKKEKKELRIVRRKAKASVEVFEISHKAKLLAAQIQRKTVKADFRENSCKELHGILKGQYKSIALTHDLSRVIQVLLKHSSEDIKTQITEELLDLMVQMAQSKYGQHAVKRILKYGTDFIRHEVLKRFFGHIVSLASHNISAPVLDYAYGEFATKKEKCHMQQEFYGEIYRNNKDSKVKSLSDCYNTSPEMKPAILSSCKANIQKILDKNLHDGESLDIAKSLNTLAIYDVFPVKSKSETSDFGGSILNLSTTDRKQLLSVLNVDRLLHSVLYDYIRECSAEQRAELISTLSPLIVPLSNSLPGANAASICVWQATNKDKKAILKVVKEHAVPLSKHKTGYRLLIAIFDSVDDTVLVKKTIVSTLATNLKDIAKDHWGNMTLHWLVKPKDPAAFHPTFTKFLEEGAKSGTSKKDADIRVAELREAVLPPLKKDIEDDPASWLSSKTNMLLAIAVLSIESSKEIVAALAKEICKPEWRVTADGKDSLAVEEAGIHMCLKKLALLDKRRTEGTFGEAVAEHLDSETIKTWLPTNRGCFFLLKLIESNGDKVASNLKKKLKPHVSLLKQQSSEGAKLLLQTVQNK